MVCPLAIRPIWMLSDAHANAARRVRRVREARPVGPVGPVGPARQVGPVRRGQGHGHSALTWCLCVGIALAAPACSMTTLLERNARGVEAASNSMQATQQAIEKMGDQLRSLRPALQEL